MTPCRRHDDCSRQYRSWIRNLRSININDNEVGTYL